MAVLNVHELGNPQGEPLLALHGINAHGRRYRKLAEEALTDRRWLAVDLRGHGRSTYDGPWSVPQHVADLCDTLDSLGLAEPIDVVGHSFGGLLALALLAAHPERVRRVLLLDPALLLPGDEVSDIAIEAMQLDGWATVDEALAFRNAGLGDEIHPSVHEEIAEHLVDGDDGRYRFRTHRPAVVTAWGELALPIPEVPQRPALLVIGERSDFVTPEVEAALLDRFGDQLHLVRLDCGHLVYWERFDDTAAAIAAFLSSG
jgi:lipase